MYWRPAQAQAQQRGRPPDCEGPFGKAELGGHSRFVHSCAVRVKRMSTFRTVQKLRQGDELFWLMVATRFAVAIHILLLLACARPQDKATSEFLARSVNTNPVVVRRITAQLARAGLIRVRRGPGGAELA